MSHTKSNGKEPPPRLSPPPLAPLQYLQNQRRGSITDPSLHAITLNTTYRPPGEPNSASSGTSSAQHDARPASPYVFGDATPHGGGEMQIRNLLRGSPEEQDKEMETDEGFDYRMRRHSIALGLQGTKRKIGEEMLAGPGVPSDEGPAPKRRGSAIDTARIARLSLDDRRNSLDSRWRRDSSSSCDPTMPDPRDDPPRQKDPTTPYSRSPELRVSHKLAERKRRKEMKDLFDELRDQLPADRGMKASKWEILSKAIEFVVHLKQSHQEMARELEILRHELDATRQGLSFAPVYGQPPTQFPIPHPMPPPLQPPQSRPTSAQNTIPSPALDSRMEPSN
ncbi:hypothetical protein H2248_006337 [Termitomyces sp. 'cryptogamus']|nr:hypothetical protein H2248_006337 [Termitomyces sp. 'cryptogamus']